MPRLSVLLPCRDAERFLPAATASIDQQTFRDLEIIAIDDGSCDGTGAVLEDWARRNRRVRVIHTPPNGIVSALETGRAQACGEMLARMDADDVAHPLRLELQVALLDERPDVAACGTRIRYFPRADVRAGAVNYEKWINSVVTPAQIARDVFVECPLPHPTLVVRRSCLESVGGWRDQGWAEDYDLVLRLWAGGHSMAKVPRVLLRWHERVDRLSRTAPAYSRAAFLRCKVHFLLANLVVGRPLLVAGSGPTGKLFAREAVRQGARLAGFVDIDPRKVGQIVHGVEVVRPEQIPRFGAAFGIAAVAKAAARAEIRAYFRAAGWTEMKGFCAVA